MADLGVPILNLPVASALSGTEWLPVVQGGTTKRTQAENVGFATITGTFPTGIDWAMGGGTEFLNAGVQGSGLIVPFACTINQVVVNATSSGSVVADIWKCTETQFDGGVTHPTSGDSITGSLQPTITNGTKYSDTTLTGWTVSLAQGDVLWYNLISVSNFKSLTIGLKAARVLP